MKIVALVFTLALTVDAGSTDHRGSNKTEIFYQGLNKMLEDARRNSSRWPLMWATDLDTRFDPKVPGQV